MKRLNWRAVPRGELAKLLEHARLEDSRAVGTTTVYHLTVDGEEQMAVSLPDGQAVIVEMNSAPPNKRRRLDPKTR
ncbi:MAG: hypothetical protein EAZ11_03755 [Curvibacter sp.]|nr:MAG: hypothetical protein EAZ11_03755 [Curvibacter sp.]